MAESRDKNRVPVHTGLGKIAPTFSLNCSSARLRQLPACGACTPNSDMHRGVAGVGGLTAAGVHWANQPGRLAVGS